MSEDFTERVEYSEEDLRGMEDHHAHYIACQQHWLRILDDVLWDEDVPWEIVVPRCQYEEVLRDAIADVLGRAYYAGRRVGLGGKEPYWQPPQTPETRS